MDKTRSEREIREQKKSRICSPVIFGVVPEMDWDANWRIIK